MNSAKTVSKPVRISDDPIERMLQRNPDVTAATMSKDDYEDAVMRWLPESLRKKILPEEYDLCFSGGEADLSHVADRSTDNLKSKSYNGRSGKKLDG